MTKRTRAARYATPEKGFPYAIDSINNININQFIKIICSIE